MRPIEAEATQSLAGAATGRRVAVIRKMARLTQTQLGALLNVTQSTVAKWETGERTADPERMTAFCARFKVSMDFLYRGRLEGVARDLALVLAKSHPDLVVLPPHGMGESTDMGQS